jgi:hypothetical protein
MGKRRQIGTRIDDSGELAEAWDEYKRDYENKSSAMRQLMRQGLDLDESESARESRDRETADRRRILSSLSVGSAVGVVTWLLVVVAGAVDVLSVSTGALVVSGIVVVSLSSVVFHLRADVAGGDTTTGDGPV